MTQNGTMVPLFILAFMILLGNNPLTAQDQVYRTFKDSRVVNIHSPETLPKGRLDVRISHRFGDIGGDNGGFATFYGLETASDVGIGGEYGVTDGLTVGLYRSKGAGVSVEGFPGLRQLLNGIGKLRLTKQEENGGAPLSATIMGMISLSTQEKLEGAGNEASIASFPNFNHRMASHVQLILARKFSDGFSLQVSPGYTHRNLVPFEDKNGMFSISTGGRVQVTRTFGLLADAVFPLIDSRKSGTGYFPAIGLGFEFETSGHIFQVNLTNATALMETDFIPYTTTDWTEGQFRLGFTISRWFNLQYGNPPKLAKLMRSFIIFLTPLLLLSLLAGFQPQDKPIEISSDTSVAEVLDALGAAPAEHRVNTDIDDVSAEIGRQLVHEGVVPYPDGEGKTRRQSKHFVCTSCHNTVKEDPDLRYADPEARLAYVAEKNIPFLPGTTLYGVVNRKTYYNGDYEKKYGDLVRPARNDLRGAIALCATECAQGRELEDWEMESILAYLWTIDLKMGDLSLPDNSLSSIEAATMGKGDKKAAAALLNSYFLDHSPATFLVPPTDRVAGYGEEGDPMNGALVYEQSCLHCHGERRYSFFNLDESTYSFNFLEKHFPTYSRYSSYQVLRYGTSPSPGKRAYMPHYTQERMSNQQVEDLRAFVSKGMN